MPAIKAVRIKIQLTGYADKKNCSEWKAIRTHQELGTDRTRNAQTVPKHNLKLSRHKIKPRKNTWRHKKLRVLTQATNVSKWILKQSGPIFNSVVKTLVQELVHNKNEDC